MRLTYVWIAEYLRIFYGLGEMVAVAGVGVEVMVMGPMKGSERWRARDWRIAYPGD